MDRAPQLGRKLFTCAVVISPPKAQWAPIQAIREKHDSAYERWMPHVNLLFPFVPPEDFATAAALASAALKDIEPFDLTFDSFKSFNHGQKSVIWLNPTPVDKVKAVQAALTRAFPFCTEQSTKSAEGFNPHLTVAQWKTQTAPSAIQNFTQGTLPKVQSFRCESVDIISRDGDVPFIVHCTVPFGGGAIVTHVTTAPADNSEKLKQIFIGSLSPSMTGDGLKQLFESRGYTVTKASVVSGKRFGFVSLSSAEEVTKCLEKEKGVIDGYRISHAK